MTIPSTAAMRTELVTAGEADVIHHQLATLVERHFADCVCAFTSGSLPYGAAVRGRSDIDVNIVLPTRAFDQDQIFDRLNGFIDDYAALHTSHGLRMDRRFPGEYLTIAQVRDAVAGRGVPIHDGVIRLPRQPDDRYWTTSEETWYLVWLGATAFSRFVTGDYRLLSELRRAAWSTITGLCLSDLPGAGFDVTDLLHRVQQPDHRRGGFGIPSSYTRFPALEHHSAAQALRDLADTGVLRRCGPRRFLLAPGQPAGWQHDLAARHDRGYTARPSLTVASSLRLAR